MTWQHRYREPKFNGTFSQAHAYVEISLTDGSFLAFGVNFKPANGPYDVERALQDCETGEELMVCLAGYVEHDSSQAAHPHPEQRTLSDEDIARARGLLEDAFDAPHDEP